MDERRRASLPTNTLDKARELRHGPTDAERKLWNHLRGGRLDGLKFRRQHPIPPYIVDFFCEAAKSWSNSMDRSTPNKLIVHVRGISNREVLPFCASGTTRP